MGAPEGPRFPSAPAGRGRAPEPGAQRAPVPLPRRARRHPALAGRRRTRQAPAAPAGRADPGRRGRCTVCYRLPWLTSVLVVNAGAHSAALASPGLTRVWGGGQPHLAEVILSRGAKVANQE